MSGFRVSAAHKLPQRSSRRRTEVTPRRKREQDSAPIGCQQQSYIRGTKPKKRGGGEEKEILASSSCESISFKDVRRKKLFAKRKILQTQIYAKPASDLIWNRIQFLYISKTSVWKLWNHTPYNRGMAELINPAAELIKMHAINTHRYWSIHKQAIHKS